MINLTLQSQCNSFFYTLQLSLQRSQNPCCLVVAVFLALCIFIWFGGVFRLLSVVTSLTHQLNKGSWINTSIIATSSSLLSCKTFMTCSQDLLNTPSVPVIPTPSTRSRFKRNRTFSGMWSNCPWSKATPKSMCMSSDVSFSIKKSQPHVIVTLNKLFSSDSVTTQHVHNFRQVHTTRSQVLQLGPHYEDDV